MSNPERRRRALHKLAISAAALAACVLPTACEYPLASPTGAPTAPGNGQPGQGGVATTAPVVVPVGNTADVQPTQDKARDTDRTSTPRPTKKPSTTTTAPTTTTTAPGASSTAPTTTAPTTTATTAPSGTVVVPPGTPTAAPPVNNGLEVLGRDCSNSNLPAHTGFQSPDAQCVSTAMGEVAPENKLPSLLITAAPKRVGVNQPFLLEVSTRNLVRDRFLGAAAGGYYLESSFLQEGSLLQRGHFHTACRILPSTSEAPDSSGAPEFFLATQDNGGGAAPDTVTIPVPGIKKAGELQCTSWAGDGSHRTPMMSRANQTPAIDSVRITVAGNAPAVQDDVDPADAQADAQQQANVQQAEAGEQKPDQDGAPQPAADAGLPAPAPAPADGDSSAPVPAEPAAAESATPASGAEATPAADQPSLEERFREVREQQEAAAN